MAYASSAGMVKIFGANAITASGGWADMDNDGDSTKITNRINQAISQADAMIDDRLRNSGYKVPLATAAGGTPTIISMIADSLAGVWLYDPRGAIDVSDETSMPHHLQYWKTWAYAVLEEIATGKRRISAVLGR